MCQYGLSVIKNPHKAPSRQVWLDEKNGKPTRYNVYRDDVREAIDYSRSPKYIEEYLRRKGYITDFTGKHWKIRLPQYPHFTATEIGKAQNESRDQVFRYIRLTNLIPEILSFVDEGRIALTPAVELSYLTESEQSYLMEIIESEDCTPTLSQAVRLKEVV